MDAPPASGPTRGSAPNLPAEITSFVGRRNDLAAIRQIFSTTRLVTLTGIGGVGKTRLALRAADEMKRALADGVCLVSLAALSEPALVPQTVADALRIREQPKFGVAAALAEHLGPRQMLLVLDNCEHLVDATANLIDQILKAAPGVRILATSRQALRIDGETVYPVTPFLAPDPSARLDPGSASHYPSVALFADRAAAVVPGFAVTEEIETAVIRLCHRLEGIPLAIELAAVQLRVLTVEELADRLDDRFQLLRSGYRNVPQRHQTLRALVDWSHDLCTPAERLLWARASVFAGGFSLAALEEVCADDALPAAALLDTLTGLVEKSIVLREDHGSHARFRMLDTIREYATALVLESAEAEVLARRHRDWIANLVETATAAWAGSEQERWARRLQLDHANIRLALEYCMARPEEAETGVRIVAQPWFWAAMDHLNEAQLWLDRALNMLSSPSHEHAWALATRGYIAAFQGDEEKLAELPERARAMAVSLDDLAALALSNHVMGFRTSIEHGDIRAAIPLFTEALRQYDESGIRGQFHDSVVVELAVTHIALQEYDRAEELTEDMFLRCTAAGERWNLSYSLWLRALIVLLRDDDAASAESNLLEALRIKRVFRDTLGFALTLEVVSWTAARTGEAERAAVIIGSTDQIWRTVGARQFVGLRRRFEAEARARIGDTAFGAARARGSRLSVEETVAYALRETPSSGASDTSANPLTRREREVADLIADGLSNKEIAAQLVISLRTAEGHVEKILAKQGFKTRTQIAAWVTRHRAGA
ncbi:ATP-binding protein [Amycolatopsis circi]|uniref:ATP-binding protein n=1 Tax=Amycolatopsis circi TaxID=871959 RepID=UPI000E25E8E8|nr:LuxR C-terminal-related transcriptional regulator [Amycolatopsis circi]